MSAVDASDILRCAKAWKDGLCLSTTLSGSQTKAPALPGIGIQAVNCSEKEGDTPYLPLELSRYFPKNTLR